jgi:hypothetical protein
MASRVAASSVGVLEVSRRCLDIMRVCAVAFQLAFACAWGRLNVDLCATREIIDGVAYRASNSFASIDNAAGSRK